MNCFRLVVSFVFYGLLRIGYAASLFVCLVLLFSGCQSVKYVPVETVKTDKVTEHDSIFVEVVRNDSVTIKTKGDTVIVDRWHTEYKNRWRDRWRDSVRVDSVAVPYPVEKELTWWERQKIAFGEWVFGVMAVLLLVVIIRKHK